LIGLREWQAWTYAGVLPSCALILVWYAGKRVGVRGSVLMATAAAAACVTVFPLGWRTWTRLEYPPQRYTAFAAWRAAIPPGAEVLWPDAPGFLWYVLERPSYWSLNQMAGSVFSRAGAVSLLQREAAVSSVLPALQPMQRRESAGTAINVS